MKKLKITLIAAIVAAMALSFASCGNDDAGKSNANTNNETNTNTAQVSDSVGTSGEAGTTEASDSVGTGTAE